MTPTYRIYVSPLGNAFIDEIAELLAAALTDLGRTTRVLREGLPEASPGHVNLLLAPPDYFHFARTRGHTEVEVCRAGEASVAVTTEQPGLEWFELSLPHLALSPLTLDINTYAADYLVAAGYPARHLQLGYHPRLDRWGGKRDASRPVDIGFLGAMTERRNRFLARAASRLWDHDCDLRLFEIGTPKQAGDPGYLFGTDKLNWLAGLKVLLNVHQSPVPYFEWARVVEALANGCVVVSEPSADVGPLQPGEHFVQAPLDLLADYAVGLLADSEGRTKMAAAAYEFMRNELLLTDTLAPLLDEIETASQPRRLGGRRTPPALPFSLPSSDAAVRAPENREMPAGLEELARTERTIGFRVKQLLVEERKLRRQLGAWRAVAEHGDPDHIDVETSPGWESTAAEVTVVIPVFQQASVVGQAIASAMGSTGVTVEVVVVDDASTDASVSAVRGYMADHPWAPLALVRHAANKGAGAARNSGFALARAPLVFPLDGDDLLYPTGLRKLATALRGSDAAFAYGIVERPDPDPEVISWMPWDVARLCQIPYISVMGLIRRSEWEALGGYDPRMSTEFSGYEDQELWLHLAAEGRAGLLVREVVARYRHSEWSVNSVMRLDVSLPLAHLRDCYPNLPWPPQL
jgi:hypothetical protein